MNKYISIVAAATLFSLPVAVMAETKLFGQLQLEVVNTSGDSVREGMTLDDGSEAGVPGAGNASALGITGSHGFENGLTALYKINFNIQADDAGGISDRDQFVGLKGDFGTFMVGRMNSPYKSTTVKWDPFLATFMQARGSNGMSTFHNGYVNNMLSYANTFNDVNLVLGLNLDETSDSDGDNNGDHGIHAGLNTALKEDIDLAVGLIQPSGDDGGTAIKIGIKWELDDGMSVVAQYENLNEDAGDQSNLYLNVSKDFGEGATGAIGFGSQSDKSSADNDGTYLALGYIKKIDKNLSWHAGFVTMDEGVISGGENASQIGGGVRLKF